MMKALKDNNNPPLEVSTTNFFNILFYPRLILSRAERLTSRQTKTYHLILENGTLAKRDIAISLGVSEDTALRELQVLMEKKLVEKQGQGKATKYVAIQQE